MTSPAQVAIVSDHVEDAREAGARILTGGKRKDGAGDWYEPTVIADADHSMKVMREETFGPVIPVMKVRDVEEAIGLANDTTYGLGLRSSRATPTGRAVAKRIEAGSINVNDSLVNYFASRFRWAAGRPRGSATGTAPRASAASATPRR